jgi:tRNA dimethylallyltransferase
VYDRINARVENMLDRGWMAEVETLLKQGYGPEDPGFQAIGYRDIVTYLHDGMGREDLVKSIQAQTRHFAKRQWTWYQKFHANWIQISPFS